ncbi:competence protein CoiA family protein, partial [Mailhella sp.]|uniref:competence protein CoiA family protein n=1 Tax=Mailhella sp. TaxID=1981029 RepID=UPI0040646B51
MKFAIVDGERREALISGQRGVCPGCGAEVVAKCGRVKTPHWAHKSKSDCDSWWQNKGEWHRIWQDEFPKEWQEIWLSDTVE